MKRERECENKNVFPKTGAIVSFHHEINVDDIQVKYGTLHSSSRRFLHHKTFPSFGGVFDDGTGREHHTIPIIKFLRD